MAGASFASAKQQEMYQIAVHDTASAYGKFSNGVKYVSVTKAELDAYRRAERLGKSVGLKFLDDLRSGVTTQSRTYTSSGKMYSTVDVSNKNRPTAFAKAKMKQQEQVLSFTDDGLHASDIKVMTKNRVESTIWFNIENTFDSRLFVTGYVLAQLPAVTGFAINDIMPTDKTQVKTGAWADRIECVRHSNKLLKPSETVLCGYTFNSKWLQEGENTFSFWYGTTQSDEGTQETYTFTV